MESIFLEFCAHCKRKTAHKILPFLFPPVARCRRVKQRCIVRFYKKGARRFPQRRMWGASHSTMPDIYLLLCAIFTSARKKYKFPRRKFWNSQYIRGGATFWSAKILSGRGEGRRAQIQACRRRRAFPRSGGLLFFLFHPLTF